MDIVFDKRDLVQTKEKFKTPGILTGYHKSQKLLHKPLYALRLNYSFSRESLSVLPNQFPFCHKKTFL